MDTTSWSLSVKDYWDIAVRRKWLILAVLATCLGIAGALCLYLPKVYRSSTLILVETQKIPESYVRPVIGGTIFERLTMIQQQVLSRTLLLKVIDEFNLYPDKAQFGDTESLIESMRKNIKIETKGGGRVEAFSISYAHQDPMMAMKVTARLASQFIEENLKVREQFVEGTTEFLQEELRRAKASLEDQERAISDFKKKYMGELPAQVETNLHHLDRLQREMTTVTEALDNAKDRQAAIHKAINAYETLGMPIFENARKAQYTKDEGEKSIRKTEDAPAAPVASPAPSYAGVDFLGVRLRELERTLASLKAEYKDTYPDVIQVKHEIEQLKAQIGQKGAATSAEPSKPGAPRRFGSPQGPDPYYHELLRQRDEAEIAVTTMKERLQRLSAQVKEYQDRVERAPTREQEMTILVRDYENTRRNYEALLDKQLNARVSENLEKRQKGETFRILDPANLPEKPEKPDLLMIMLAGLAVGCGLGYAIAFSLEQWAPPFRRPEEVESILGLPVLATIPVLQTAYRQSPFKALPLGAQLPDRSRSQSTTPFGAASKGDKKASQKAKRFWHFGTGHDKRDQTGEAAAPTVGFPMEYNLVARWRPSSVVAEQYRVAATRLVLLGRERRNTVMVVTSAVKGEGKSTTSINLAYVLARDLGKSTLVIDCDLKRPVLHTYASVGSEPGLAEVLRGENHLDACLHGMGELPLWILPAGSTEDKPVELGKVHLLAELLPQLRKRFEFIILDAPPILPLADMNVLASMADVMTLVVRAEVTRRDVVQKALATLKPTNQVGVVVTGLWTNQMPYYMQEYYYARERASQHAA
jgi:polysaccharide chain length determinant protein (PEP-CTERM system associated)